MAGGLILTENVTEGLNGADQQFGLKIKCRSRKVRRAQKEIQRCQPYSQNDTECEEGEVKSFEDEARNLYGIELRAYLQAEQEEVDPPWERGYSYNKHNMKTRHFKGRELEGINEADNKKSLEKGRGLEDGSNNSRWCLEEEIAKMIETRTSKGVDFKATGNEVYVDDHWNVEDKVAKVIQTGVELGFDFNGDEMQVANVITRREVEDFSRFKERKNTFSWNVRRFGRIEKMRMVRKLVAFHKPIICFLQETKLRSFDHIIVKSLRDVVLSKGVGVEAVSSTGGLITMWNDRMFKATIPLLWCIGGDFNTVLDPLERKGGDCNKNSMKSFNDFILKAMVVDIPMHGIYFTCSNFRDRVS
ncbi:hypothetical protein Dsin_012279 [Dipteronia sinensis]|uniref:Uncharacterized protein n=1 Tax=Dipteronia sinensis TaxID=43782 RepID=A0AAE0AJ01_9ROSI|nr:hypothetical protein Dsin_012279 [Dipteronia sinensis]